MKYSQGQNTMHDYNGYHQYNITNITHVHVSRPSRPKRPTLGFGSNHHHGHKGNWRKHGERPPRLARFCGSCGILDQHVLAGMSQGEMCSEAVNVIGYSARGLGRSVESMAKNACSAASCMAKGIYEIGKAILS